MLSRGGIVFMRLLGRLPLRWVRALGWVLGSAFRQALAKLGRAKVVPVITRMTPGGYEVQVMPSWPGFPSDDRVAHTARMNEHLQSYTNTMPDPYFWVHKRFKVRPPGVASVY